MAWVSVWQGTHSHELDGFDTFRGAEDAPLDALTLWLEIAMPQRRPKPLRLWQGKSNRGVEVYLMPNGALRVLHGAETDMSTPPDFLAPGQMLVLRLILCGKGRTDIFDALNSDTGARHQLRAGMASPPTLADALPRVPGFLRLSSVAAIATHAVPGSDLPGLECGALVETPDGPIPVEAIRPGMSVLGDDGESHVVRWTAARERLCLGRRAPVLLRAPYFGLGADTCVTPETRLVRQGAEVEYLAGTETVLVRAADLASGTGARFDRRRPLRRFHHMMLDDPACLRVWRCRIETAYLGEVLASEDSGFGLARPDGKDCAPSLPLLDRASARSLMPRGRGVQTFVL